MKTVALIKGDGTGPELVEAMLLVLRASGATAEFVTCDAGAEWWEKHGGTSMVPEETWRTLEGADCCFKGPTTTLTAPGTPRSVAVSIRQRFDLYANVRPIKTFPDQVGHSGRSTSSWSARDARGSTRGSSSSSATMSRSR